MRGQKDTVGQQESRNPTIARSDNIAIWVLLASGFTVILNETVMGVALPVLMHELSVNASTGQWLTTAFLLTMSVVIPVTGTLIQRLSTRRLFFIAMIVFLCGTVLCAVAPGFEVLLLGRVVQAIGTAITMPLLMTTVISVVPKQIQGRIMGRVSIVISVAPALGPAASGLIIEHFSWRWLFVFMLPIIVTVVAGSAFFLRNVGDVRPVRIDALSVLLAALGFGGVVYSLNAFGHSGAGVAGFVPLVLLCFSALALLFFVLRQLRLQRDERPLLDLRVFQRRAYTLGVVIMVISMMAMFGMIVLLPIFASDVLGMQTFEIGLLLLPGGLLMGLMAPFVGRLTDRYGVRRVLLPGTLATITAIWGFSLLNVHTPAWYLLLCHMLLGVGLACTFTPVFANSLGSLPPHLSSHGSAIISTLQQLAGAAGTALLVAIFTAVTLREQGGFADTVEATAAGIRAAYTVGAVIVSSLVVLGLMLPKGAAPARG